MATTTVNGIEVNLVNGRSYQATHVAVLDVYPTQMRIVLPVKHEHSNSLDGYGVDVLVTDVMFMTPCRFRKSEVK